MYDPRKGKPRTSGYPKDTAYHWEGIWSGGVDAVINRGNGDFYFFKNDMYAKYNLEDEIIAPQYPRQTSTSWSKIYIAPNMKTMTGAASDLTRMPELSAVFLEELKRMPEKGELYFWLEILMDYGGNIEKVGSMLATMARAADVPSVIPSHERAEIEMLKPSKPTTSSSCGVQYETQQHFSDSSSRSSSNSSYDVSATERQIPPTLSLFIPPTTGASDSSSSSTQELSQTP